MAQVKQVKIKKAQIDKMPKDEITLLVMLGCYGNEIATFLRLESWSLSCSEHTHYIDDEARDIEYEARTSQVFLFSRLLIGKLVEFNKALEKCYGKKISQKYSRVIAPTAKDSLDAFRKGVGSPIFRSGG
jgi:hypothetical protein